MRGLHFGIIASSGASGPPWTPMSPGTPSLWGEADTQNWTSPGGTGVPTDGSTVAKADDLSGSGNHLGDTISGSTYRPTWKANIFGTKPALLFSGAQAMCKTSATLPSEGTACTVAVVVEPTAYASNPSFPLAYGSSVPGVSTRLYVGYYSGQVQGYVNDTDSGSAIVANSQYILIWTFDGTTLSLYRNGVAKGTGTPSYSITSSDRVFLGIENDNTGGAFTAPYTGYVAAWLVYPTAISSGDVAALDTYWNAKYTVH